MTTNWVDLLNHIADGRDLPPDEVSAAMHSIMSGEASPAKIASFIYGIRVKGITPTELEAAASTMLDFAQPVKLPPSPNDDRGPAVDIVGTGGDGAHTVNVSTMASLLIASMGIDVIKHGNRAASSRSGGADMLEALGVPIDLSPDDVTHMLSQHHFAFIFARTYHPAMKYAAPVRSDIKVPTLFNLLGPMTNPARPTAGLIGCAFPEMTSVMADAFARRGDTVLVVHGQDGLDEFSVSGPTDVYVTHDGGAERYEFDPRDYGFSYYPVSAIRGGDADTNARVARQLFSLDPVADTPTTPLPCDMSAVENAVLFSAAGALVSAQGGDKESFRDAMGHALDRAKAALHDEGTKDRIQHLVSEKRP